MYIFLKSFLSISRSSVDLCSVQQRQKEGQDWAIQRRQDRRPLVHCNQAVFLLFFAPRSLYRYNYEDLLSLWNFLYTRFFAFLDIEYSETVATFYRDIRKLFIINCLQNGKKDIVCESPFVLDHHTRSSNTWTFMAKKCWRSALWTKMTGNHGALFHSFSILKYLWLISAFHGSVERWIFCYLFHKWMEK